MKAKTELLVIAGRLVFEITNLENIYSGTKGVGSVWTWPAPPGIRFGMETGENNPSVVTVGSETNGFMIGA